MKPSVRLPHAAFALFACAAAAVGYLRAATAAHKPRLSATPPGPEVLAQLDSLKAAGAALLRAAEMPASSAGYASGLQREFDHTRNLYKRLEWFIGYFVQPAALELNGPPIDEVELKDGPDVVRPAKGLQVLEEMLYPKVDTRAHDAIAREARWIRDVTDRTRMIGRVAEVGDDQAFDAFRFEIARVSVLGVTGFDSPVRRASLTESAHAMLGLRRAVGSYVRNNKTIDSLFDAADAHLRRGAFDGFDRLAFIATVANPLAHAIAGARDRLRIRVPLTHQLWRASAPTLFERDAFDPDALRPSWSPEATPARVRLGEKLFADPALSGPGSRSCASCHEPAKAFTDGRARSAALAADRVLRNAPTLLNAALQTAQFADMRAFFLEDQVEAVVTNEAEMSGTLSESAHRLRVRAGFEREFATAFGRERDSAITPFTIRAALAAYVRSLTRLDSRVDRALRGDTLALSAEERTGFNLFAGKAMCATCHYLPLTNGTVPPLYQKMELEVVGVPSAPVWTHAKIDPDSGRARITKAPLHLHAFKTPSVRNAGVTAPYMHNGVYRTLDEVVRFYDLGGGQGIGIKLPNQTLPADKLNLTDAEKAALVKFMQALTDTGAVTTPVSPLRQGDRAPLRRH